MQKTKKSIAKRFKVTATGKVLRRTPGHRHILSAKSRRQKARMCKDRGIGAGFVSHVKRAMPSAF
jgi:large subunit ribosomal protein L35